ncbi:MAG: hypothetical protein LRY32_01490, partial [Flavobacterium sp.]|nr:hypothetical protein [Flavobacterium sp.]
MYKSEQDLLDQNFSETYRDAALWKRLANYILDIAFLAVGFLGFLFAVGFGTALADPNLPEKL